MSWKNTQQTSLADALVIEHKSLSELDDVHNIIFWPEIEQTLSGLYSSVRGAPAYPPLMMFKILILQDLKHHQWWISWCTTDDV